jgi:hypothetical protein
MGYVILKGKKYKIQVPYLAIAKRWIPVVHEINKKIYETHDGSDVV